MGKFRRFLKSFSEPLMAGEARSLLRVYLGYRVALAVILSALLFTGLSATLFGTQDQNIYALIVVMYLVLSIASISLCQCNLATSKIEYLFAILIDSLAISMFVYTSGGIQSGLGLLLGVSVAFGGLGMPRRTAILAASIASLSILGVTFYSSLTHTTAISEYTQIGLLGFSYFALALLAHELSSRATASEKLAQERGEDLASVTELNQYVIQGMNAGVVVVNSSHTLRMANDSSLSLLGVNKSCIGEPLSQLSKMLDTQLTAWHVQPFNHKIIIRTKPDSHELQVSFRSLGDANTHGTLILLEDTGLLMEQAQQLKLASLGRLTASIAHEIRNPLGAISHAAQLLAESTDLDATEQRMTEIIGNNSKRVNAVIENILAMSRRLPSIPVEMELLHWLTDLFSELADSHGLHSSQLILSVQPEDLTIFTDKQQLSQILTSLFDNAVAHFDKMPSELVITITSGINESLDKPYIQVLDNGPGISAEIASKIFDPFYTTRHDGTGLGLYITRELCEANNIKLEYIPLEKSGSCFQLTLSNTEAKHYGSGTSTYC